MKRHIPNFLTCMNLAVGSLGCISAVQGDFHQVIFFVLIAGAFDFLDGFAARMLKVQSEIGKQLDSLADVISFGLLPALFMTMLLSERFAENTIWPLTGLLIVAFSALRLAKFNIDDSQGDQFYGLPTPANAIMTTSLVLLDFPLDKWVLVGIAVLSCLLLVSRIPLLALKFSSFGIKDNWPKYLLIILVVVAIGFFQLGGIALIVPLYLLVSMLWNFAPKKYV